jgi:hypothetical protein
MRWVLVLLVAFGALVLSGAALAAPPGNDGFSDATAISALPFSDTVDLTEATFEAGEPPGCYYSPNKSVWYSFTPADDMIVEVTTPNSSYDRSVVVFRDTGGGITGLEHISCAYPWSNAVARVRAGETYYIQAAYQWSSGDLNLEVAQIPPPPNDDFADASAVGSVPFSDSQTALAATVEPGEPTPSCGPTTENSFWYAFTAPADGSYTVHTSGGFTTIAFFRGSSLGDLTEIDCATYGNTSRSVHSAEGEITYVRISDAYGGSNGPVTVSLDVAPSPVADFWYWPSDPSRFDTVSFNASSYDPGGNPIVEQVFEFGDGTSASGCCVQHAYGKDGSYTVRVTATTSDGRSATAEKVLQVRTHDVAIAKLTVPQTANAGQTRSIVIGLTNAAYAENVQVVLYRSVVGGGFEQVGSLTQPVPVRGPNRTTSFSILYTFTPADAAVGKVTFKAVATILGARDALPADNEAVALPTVVR